MRKRKYVLVVNAFYLNSETSLSVVYVANVFSHGKMEASFAGTVRMKGIYFCTSLLFFYPCKYKRKLLYSFGL